MKWTLAVPLIAVLAFPAAAAPAEDAKAIKDSIKKCVDSVIAVLREKDMAREERKTLVKAALEPLFDLPQMASLTLYAKDEKGKKYWARLSESEQKEFIELFVTTVQDSYYEKLELFTDETVDYDEPVASKQGYVMPTRIKSKNQVYKLIYMLHRPKGSSSFKVYDLEINGISLVRTFGPQYVDQLKKGKPADLLAVMRKKLEEPASGASEPAAE